MTRFYLRVILLMLLAFLTGIVIILLFLGGLEQLYFRPNFAGEMKEFAAGIENRLKGKTVEEAQATLEGLENKLIFQVRALRLEDAVPEEGAFLYYPKGAGYILELRPDAALLTTYQERVKNSVFVALILSGAIIFLAALFVVLPLVRKLRLQEQTITAIAEGDLSVRAPEGSDALGKLGSRLNQMTQRIKELLSSQRQLINAVSHEMRTPTARLGFGLEMIANAKSAPEREERIAAMHDDLGELDRLLDELLRYLRFDQGEEEFSLEELDLSSLFLELRDKVLPFGEGIAVECEGIAPGDTVLGNAHHLPRALENLLRNAVRHAESKVVLRFIRQEQGNYLCVDDDGPGIPVPERQRVFEPFVRLDSSRDRKTGGTGLGLAIAHRIVSRHHGSLTVDDSPEGGARFALALPTKQSDPPRRR